MAIESIYKEAKEFVEKWLNDLFGIDVETEENAED